MNNKYKSLFEPLVLPNGVELRNRFVLAPLTHISSNDDGTISDVEIPYMLDLLLTLQVILMM